MYECVYTFIHICMYVYICIHIKRERESMSKLYGCFDDLALDPELQVTYIHIYIYTVPRSLPSHICMSLSL